MTRINSDNLFGLSAFIVDPLASEGSFTTIQAAINAASAGDEVFVKTGVYVENLVLKAGVDLFGVAVDGRIPNGHIQVTGNHTYAGNGFVGIQGMSFSAPGGTIFTVTGFPAGTTVVAIKFCDIDSPIGSAGVITGGIGGGAAFVIFSSNINAQLATFIVTDAQVQVQEASFCGSNTAECFQLNGSSGVSISSGSDANAATACVVINSVTANFSSKNSTLFAPNECILFNAAGNAESFNTVMRANAVSGFYVAGAGSYRYAGDIVTDSATLIDPAVSQSPFVWRPFATDGTAVTAVRGTAGFDSTQFTVTNGFVQLTGAIPGLVWTDELVNTTVTSNSGSFAAIAVSLTLPPVPLQGDRCEFKLDGLGPLNVVANVGQTLRFGSVTGTIATTTAQGDAVILTYRVATTSWIANSIVGAWSVV